MTASACGGAAGAAARRPQRPDRRAMPLKPLTNPFRRRLSRRLVRAARSPERVADMSLRELVETLGERSFAWTLVLFALVNLVPMLIGSNMITSIPLILVTAQMALGLPQVHLPDFIMRRQLNRKSFQKLVLRLGPVIRPVERMLRPRHGYLFTPRAERAVAIFLLVVSLALFLPIPLSGYLPAGALFIAGVGLVERDGLVMLGGLLLGAVALAVTASMGLMLVHGAQALAQ